MGPDPLFTISIPEQLILSPGANESELLIFSDIICMQYLHLLSSHMCLQVYLLGQYLDLG
jgi:hypothetical protein